MVSVIDKLLALARRGDGEGVTAPNADAAAQLAAALAELAAERESASSALRAAAADRDRLLLEPASDSALDELDRTIEREQRRIERCDRIEPLLMQQLADAREAGRQRAFVEYVERYRAAVSAYATAMRRTLALRAGIVAVRQEAEIAGFPEAARFFDVPHLQSADPDRFEFAVGIQLDSAHARARPEGVRIRFTKLCGIYRTGDVVAFDPDEAQRYLAAGVAERTA